MIEAEFLRIAEERGIIDPVQAERLLALAAEVAVTPGGFSRAPLRAARPESYDNEKLRLVSGFGDIFVTIGIALFIGSAAYFTDLVARPGIKWAAVASLAWMLAEFFTRRRRMALPSIALLVVFTSAALLALLHGVGGATTSYQLGRGRLINTLGIDLRAPSRVALASLVTAGCVGLHYLRFRVPITVAAVAAALAGAALALLVALTPESSRSPLTPLLVCGIVVFALAMRFDMADPGRTTRSTDIAFWLHLLAAPLIVHPLVAPLLEDAQARDLNSAALILVVFLVLSLVAVVIDRRAMLVSGLIYAGVAFGTLVSRTGLGGERILPATLLALGAFILLLSAGWGPLRRALLRILPAPLSRRLPSPLIAKPSILP